MLIERDARDWERREGIAQGREEGRIEERLNMAKKMKQKGSSVADIADITGLSEGEINSL